MKTTARRLPAVQIALAGALLTAFLVFISPLSASAHDSLLTSSPEAGSTVETLPSELTLTFSAKLIDGEGATEVVVTDAAGASVATAQSTVNGAIVTQPLIEQGKAGEYHVIWKIVSSDGHPTSGEFDFTVSTATVVAPAENATAAPQPAPSSESAAPADPAQPEEPETAPESSISPAWIIGAIVITLIAVFLVIYAVRGRHRSDTGTDSDSLTGR